MQNARFTALHLSDLADQAERFMLMSYERLPYSLVLHNDSWALALAGHAKEIAMRRPGASPDIPPLARTIALLEACRYWGVGTELRSWTEVAQEFREWTGPDYLQLQLALAANLPGGSSALNTEVADVLYDAQLAQRILSGPEGAELTWLENRYGQHNGILPRREISRAEAMRVYLDELRQARFRDGEHRRRYQHTHSAVLLDLQKLVDRLEKKELSAEPPIAYNKLPADQKLQYLEEGPTRQAVQTYFRTTFRNHIQLKRIADQKAAIMVSVNVLLIGALLTFISYRNWVETKPEILMPVGVFVVSGLASLIYSLVAARPAERKDEEGNLAYFGSFSKLSREVFTERMERALLDPNVLYGTLIRDLYGLGGTVARKYNLLRIAYNIFLIGLSTTIFFLTLIIFFF